MNRLLKVNAVINASYRKSLVLLLITLLFGLFYPFSLATSAEVDDQNWGKLRKEWKFSSSRSSRVNLKGYFYTRKVLKELYGQSWIKKAPEKLRRIRDLESRWPKKTPLKLIVKLKGNQFHSWEIVFNQGGREKRLENFADLYTFSDIEGVGRLPDSGSFDLFIRIPEWLNLTRPFDLFYGGKKFSLGPLYTSPD